MATFSISTATTTAQSLIGGEIGLVSDTGSILAATASAVSVNGGGTLVIGGAVVSGTAYGAHYFGAGVGYLTLSSSAILAGNRGVQCESSMADFYLNNAGTIQGETGGVSVYASNTTLMNSGAIYGNNSTGIYLQNSIGFYVSNSGVIEGSNYGVYQQDIGGGTIFNSGRIAGVVEALHLSNGADRVTNAGVLAGDVKLGEGADTFLGASGTQDWVYGEAGNDSIVGGAGDERLDGGTENDALRGNGGEDRMWGQTGVDTLVGGIGDDTADGGAGADWVYGGAGDDILGGGTENDHLIGGAGNDLMNGGAGADIFVFAQGHGFDRVASFTDNFDKLDLREFDIASLAVLKAHASDSSYGVQIDLRSFSGGTITLTGMTLAALTVQDFYF